MVHSVPGGSPLAWDGPKGHGPGTTSKARTVEPVRAFCG